MVTTVRKGVFETNSSSTHSLSFEPNNSEDFEIKNGIIDLNKLKKFLIYSTKDCYDQQTLICDTLNKKLGLLFALYPNYEEIPKLVEIAEKYQIKEIVGKISNIWDEDNEIDRIINVLENVEIKIISFYENN